MTAICEARGKTDHMLAQPAAWVTSRCVITAYLLARVRVCLCVDCHYGILEDATYSYTPTV